MSPPNSSNCSITARKAVILKRLYQIMTRDGIGVAEACRAVNAPRKVVLQWVAEARGKAPVQRAITLYHEGLSIEAAADQAGCSPKALTDALKKQRRANHS